MNGAELMDSIEAVFSFASTIYYNNIQTRIVIILMCDGLNFKVLGNVMLFCKVMALS